MTPVATSHILATNYAECDGKRGMGNEQDIGSHSPISHSHI